jgi:hypothetical protein
MSASDQNAKLQEAITLAQAGQRIEARHLLEEVVAAEPGLELAWMWLATVSTNREERIEYLERALALNSENPTTQQAYEQLTGQPYSPPAAAAPAVRAGWWASLTQDAPLSLTHYIVLLMVAALGVVIVLVVINRRNDDESTPAPTFTPAFIPPTFTPTPLLSPTPSSTPRPTRTPGPSPTSIWDNPPPTWTPRPSLTIFPSSTPQPSSTPLPTLTSTPTVPPWTPTITPLPPSDTPPPLLQPSATPTATQTLTPTPEEEATGPGEDSTPPPNGD